MPTTTDNETTSTPSKRQKLNPDNDNNTDDSNDKDNADDSKTTSLLDHTTKDDNTIKFTRRWMEQDRQQMMKLYDKFEGAAMYQWEEQNMEFSLPPSLEEDADTSDNNNNNNPLIGYYDIVFCHGEPGGTDQGWTDGQISRTTTSGTLTIYNHEIPAGDYFYEEGRTILYGRINNIQRSFIRDDSGWEGCFQMNDVVFRQFPDDFFGSDGPNFCVVQNDGCDVPEELEANIRILQNSGTLDWTPNEAIPTQEQQQRLALGEIPDDNTDQAYVHFLRDCLNRRQDGDPGEATDSVFADVAAAPNSKWAWKPGDIVLKFEMTDYATDWETIYVARRRS